MIGTTFPQANLTLKAPPGQEEHVYDLPVWTDGEHCLSRWEPTPEERAAVAAGGPVWLWVVGSTHPPLCVSAANPFVNEPGKEVNNVPLSVNTASQEVDQLFQIIDRLTGTPSP